MFKNIKLKINNFFRKKRDLPERTLSLIHIHTFPGGEKIYTYKTEDWGKISSRYYRAIQENSKYLNSFNLTPNEWTSALDECMNLCTEAVSKKNNKEDIMLIHNSLLWFKQKIKGVKTTVEAELEFLFCMFYILDEEKETGYSPIHNAKKVALLNDNLDLRDFFFLNLKEQCKDFIQPSREDTLRYLTQTEAILKMAADLTGKSLKEN